MTDTVRDRDCIRDQDELVCELASWSEGPSLPDRLAENPRLKRFMSRVEQDYGSTPKMATATQTGDLLPPGKPKCTGPV